MTLIIINETLKSSNHRPITKTVSQTEKSQFRLPLILSYHLELNTQTNNHYITAQIGFHNNQNRSFVPKPIFKLVQIHANYNPKFGIPHSSSFKSERKGKNGRKMLPKLIFGLPCLTGASPPPKIGHLSGWPRFKSKKRKGKKKEVESKGS